MVEADDSKVTEDRDSPPSRRQTRLLVFIILLGFLLRVSTILWGAGILPYTGRYHADEFATFRHAIEFPGNYGTDTHFVHGSTIPYLLAVVILPAKQILTSSQWYSVCLLGMRVLSVLAGVGAIPLIYLLALRVYNRRTAMLAAAFTAVSFTHCMNSAFATQDVIVSFLLIGCFLALHRAFASEKESDFFLLGGLTGLLLGTKISLAVFLFVLPLIAVARVVQTKNGERKISAGQHWFGRLLICGCTAFLVFAITSPHVLFDLSGFLGFWKEAKSLWYDRTTVPLGQVPKVWWSISAIAVGTTTLIASIVGAMLPSRNRELRFAILTFILFYYLFHRHHLYPRFVASVAPLICLFAARACTYLFARRFPLLRYAGATLAAVILGISLLSCLVGIYARFKDPRTEAALWLKDHVKSGTTVGIAEVDPGITSWEHPPLDGLGLKRVPFQTRPEVIIVSSNSYDAMDRALRSPKLKNWIWDPNDRTEWYAYVAPSPEIFRFFDELIHETGEYHLETNLEVPGGRYVSVDFAHLGIRIYRRTATKNHP